MPIAEGTSTDGKLSAQAPQDGQGGTEPISQTKAEHRYIYYRLYTKDGALESHYPIYSNDCFISRILSKSVRPPHTVAALKRCLCRVEGFEGPENSSLYLTLSEATPLDDSNRLSIRDNSGPGSSELNSVVLVVDLGSAERRSKAKIKTDPKELLVWQIEQRYIYYRLYDEDIEAVSKTSFDENDTSLGRINTFSIPPPHTVASLKYCLVKAEAIPGYDVQLLENEDGEITMNDSDTIAILADDFPGFTEDQPIVFTYARKPANLTTALQAAFSDRLTVTQSWPGSTMDATWNSVTTGEIFQTDGIQRTESFTYNTSPSDFPSYEGINSSGKGAFVHAAPSVISPPREDFLTKILIIGDSGVGKSCLLHRFCDETWTPSITATIGVDFKIRTIELDGGRMKLQIWDTSGLERYITITTGYYPGAMGILLVYDVTDVRSFDNIRRWHNNVEQHAPKGVNKILIGNKSEGWDTKRAVTEEQGRELAKELGIRFLETSAKLNEGVETAFFALAGDIKTRLMD